MKNFQEIKKALDSGSIVAFYKLGRKYRAGVCNMEGCGAELHSDVNLARIFWEMGLLESLKLQFHIRADADWIEFELKGFHLGHRKSYFFTRKLPLDALPDQVKMMGAWMHHIRIEVENAIDWFPSYPDGKV